MSVNQISIADAIEELRDQIREARRRIGDDPLVFSIREVTVEIQGTLSKSVRADGSARVEFSVIGFGVEGAGGAERTTATQSIQTVCLTLDVGDRSAPGVSIAIGAEREGRY